MKQGAFQAQFDISLYKIAPDTIMTNYKMEPANKMSQLSQGSTGRENTVNIRPSHA